MLPRAMLPAASEDDPGRLKSPLATRGKPGERNILGKAGMSELKLRPPKTMKGDRSGRPCRLRAVED
jgi:hypothetical protein